MVDGPSVSVDRGHAAERQDRPGGGGDERRRQGVRVGALAVGQPHHQREAPLALADLAHLRAAHRLDHGQHVAPGHAEARDRRRVDAHLQHAPGR